MKIRNDNIESLLLLSALGMRIATEPTANFSYFIIAAYSLLGRSQAIKALAISWLFSMLNPGLVAESTAGSTGRFVVIATASLSVFLRSSVFGKNPREGSMPVATLALGILFIAHSFLFSPIPDVSVLKALSWTLATATLLAAWSSLNKEDYNRTANQIFGGLVGILICSLPILFLPVGYLRNESGFQGVLGHPQVFGPTIALLGVWASARMLSEPRPPLNLVILSGICLVLIVLSEARTAGFGMVLGLISAIVLLSLLSRQPLLQQMPAIKSQRTFLVVGVSLIGALISGSALTDRIGSYVDKWGGGGGFMQSYDSSRGRLINEMLNNISMKPLTGIGFGIASHPNTMIVNRDSFFGLPSGAPVEKGVLPFQVVEETGVFGAIAVILWMSIAIKRASRGTVTTLSMSLTVLLLNLGESTFFSPGGMGLLPLILFTWAVTVSPSRGKS